MLVNADLLYVLIPAIFIWVVIALLVRLHARDETDLVKRALREFRLSVFATGSILILLWFLLPRTPVLSTFGYPQDVEIVRQPTRLLSLLRDYNRALVRTTEVVYWFLFVMVWWFISSVYFFAKALTLARPVPGAPVAEPRAH
jgi:hypothetical protein